MVQSSASQPNNSVTELEQSDSSLKSDKFTSAIQDDLDSVLYEYEMGHGPVVAT